MGSSLQKNTELLGLKIRPQPDFEAYQKRQHLLRESGCLAPAHIPKPFPAAAVGPSVWTPGDIKLDDLTLELSTGDILEIETALALFKGT